VPLVAVFHYLALRAFAHETEDPARVKTALRFAAHDERVALEETHVEGSHGNKIVILETEVKAAPAVKKLFGQLATDDPRGFEQLLRTWRERVDDNLNFHLRLDKQDAARGRMALAQDDDAITVRGKIRSFETKRSGSDHAASLRDLEAFFLGISPSERAVGQ